MPLTLEIDLRFQLTQMTTTEDFTATDLRYSYR